MESLVERAVKELKKGNLIVSPTDTIYGILADATNEEAVKKLYEIRRPSGRPFIVLLPDESWIEEMCLEIQEKAKPLLRIEGLTLVLPKRCRKYDYINRDSLAIRIPRRGIIKEILKRLSRPVVAPSANPEGEKPAESVEEARKYFGDKVALYIDGGVIKGEPSTVVSFVNGIKILREGKVEREEIEKIIGKL